MMLRSSTEVPDSCSSGKGDIYTEHMCDYIAFKKFHAVLYSVF